MNLVKLAAPLAALGALAAAGTACADEPSIWAMDQPHFFAGGGVGYNWLNGAEVPNQPGDDFEGSNVSYKALGGWSFNRIWNLEAQYINFGTNDDGDNRIKATAWTTSVVANIPVTPHVVPFVKAGAFFWDADGRFATTAGGQEETDGDGTDLVWGGGIKFPITERLDMRLEYERFTFGDFDRNTSSGGGAFDRVDGPDANMATAAVVFNF